MATERWSMPPLFTNLRAPVSVQFEITYRCNNRCIFCHNPRGTESSDISLTLGKMIIDRLAQAKVFSCIFTGGEPILHPQCLALMEYARGSGLKTAIISNGVAIGPHIPSLIDIGCDSFEISVLGSSPLLHEALVQHPGAFDKAMAALEALSVYPNKLINVNATVTSRNFADIGAIYRKVRDHGARSFTITRFVPTNPNDEITPTAAMLNTIIRDLLKARAEVGMPFRFLTPVPFCAIEPDVPLPEVSTAMSRCDGAVSWCTITPYGTLKPCPCWHINCGDLTQADCATVWKTDPVRARIAERGYYPKECLDCSLKITCGAGCRACAPQPDAMDYMATAPVK